MIELIVNKSKEEKTIAAIENGKLVEIYEENEQSSKARNEGNIYLGIVKDIVPGMQAAFVDIGTEKNSFIHVKDVVPQVDEKVEKRIDTKIKDAIKAGEKILVQIQKDSNDKKGARTSTHIKLTGKYVVLMPNTNIVTISQKIENESEKGRLLKILRKLLPENTGVIVRTAAVKKNEEELKEDLEQLLSKWKKIKEKFDNAPSKSQLLYKSPSILEKIILDLPENRIEKIMVNYEATIEIAKQLRLRDIGGIIIIDYIDMQKEENKNKIEKLLKESLKQDRAKTQVEGFTKLNLMELTRKHICSHNS